MILDASVAIAWSIEEEHTPAILDVLSLVTEGGAYVPQLWNVEVANVLLMKGRRGKIPMHTVSGLLEGLSRLGIETDSETSDKAWGITLALAMRHNLTVYDATYLELAVRKHLTLATIDDKLVIAARAEGLAVLP
ncbi:MAG: type II toxin-antitoxin system VapC family toxin [Candidatus Devosia phytovorans]|uniref:Type II toxin-antitoxin system VapC family toxin n=1 Tax=Candidatus Devosia phytovorans TaxID=3121372 RepID=A0AAJ6B162_9HYPH|nr:type II toxin-antitoxin system VapC family toxin [Devosia sp.]WEK05436.1 MAG: type II toxin-antitoxin system VapC family toxin [Devosia sp.]